MTDWPHLRSLIDALDPSDVAAAVRELDAAQRQELAEPVRGYERFVHDDAEQWPARLPAFAVAGAAVLPMPDLVHWFVGFARASVSGDESGKLVLLVADVLRARDVPWLPEFTDRLASRLPRAAWTGFTWDLVTELCAGAELPTADGYVRNWFDRLRSEADLIVASVRQDERFLALVPRMFDVDGFAAMLDPVRWPRNEFGWRGALVQLAAEGVVQRAVLLDGCLRALRRAETVNDARGFLALLDLLDPTTDELHQRATDFVAVLSGTHATATSMAQAVLRRLDESGRLEPHLLLDATRAVLPRTEKRLVRAQLMWLTDSLRRDDVDRSALLRAVAVAFAHDSAEIQQRALDLVLEHADQVDARTELAAASRHLPADLQAQASAVLGPPPGEDLPPRVYGWLDDEERGLRAIGQEILCHFAERNRLGAASPVWNLCALATAERGLPPLTRLVPRLREVAREGAPAQVWDLVAAVLPHALPAEGERPLPGLADLIALGAELAEHARSDGPIPGLERVAQRRGSSRFVEEARRLVRLRE